jgi:hypothetical protein
MREEGKGKNKLKIPGHTWLVSHRPSKPTELQQSFTSVK